MKKVYFLLLGLFFFSGVNAQIINFPSANFKGRLIAASSSNTTAKNLSGNYFKIDSNNDGQVEVAEALEVSYLDISSPNSSDITNTEGLQYFTNLVNLYCQNNLYSAGYTLDVSMLSSLQTLTCNNNGIKTLNVNGLTNLREIICGNNSLTSLDVSSLINLEILKCNNDFTLTTLNVSGLNNLRELHCFESRNLASVNLTGCTALTKIMANRCKLNALNLTGLNNLSYLECSSNPFTTLNASNLPSLTFLQAANCAQMTSLDVSNSSIYRLWCSYNQLTTVNLQNCVQLYDADFGQNQLTSLNTNDCINLTTMKCSNNLLTTLDVSNCNKLYSLFCANNNLTSLFLKNGIFNSTLNFAGNPNLSYICYDDDASIGITAWGEEHYIQTLLVDYGITGCNINTYCSFVPGGTYYTIEGKSKFDLNDNGCDINDVIFQNLKFSIANGPQAGDIISNASGNFSIPVQAGTHTITPVFENPTYFNASPTSATVTFPTQASPFTQDFCITANGVHPDLEITILPIRNARPGFDVAYKIIYKNKGTTTQSGSVNLAFDDSVLDFVSSNPATTNQSTNNLSWDFTNLLPFETREITLTLNVNSPMETPAVNSGDILNYTATITSPATDDTPNDNTIAFHQTVVNSYDPNDKTCLEGTTISPTMVGEYVHYVIRFENTGTFPAENIVVKDMIDLAKFDINTLVPIKGSHDFVTNITAGNKVEFIFENINLPFDDANNDGFVAFKIKTKANLVVGNTFSNSANIYFDYNFPIVTNTYTTTVQTLGKQDFDFAKYFKVYPIPASSTLNLEVKSGIVVNSISIYNMLGQLVIAVPNAQSVSNIDVSNLKTGNYFIKMITDKGTSNSKFIKN